MTASEAADAARQQASRPAGQQGSDAGQRRSAAEAQRSSEVHIVSETDAETFAPLAERGANWIWASRHVRHSTFLLSADTCRQQINQISQKQLRHRSSCCREPTIHFGIKQTGLPIGCDLVVTIGAMAAYDCHARFAKADRPQCHPKHGLKEEKTISFSWVSNLDNVLPQLQPWQLHLERAAQQVEKKECW